MRFTILGLLLYLMGLIAEVQGYQRAACHSFIAFGAGLVGYGMGRPEKEEADEPAP